MFTSVFCEDLYRTVCSHFSPTLWLHPLPPLQWVSLWVGLGRSFSPASYQLGTRIIRNFYGNFYWPDPSCCPAGFTCRWVKFPNWLIWVTNVSQGSLIVSIGHIGVYMQYSDKGYAQGRIITMHLLWPPAFTQLLQLGPNTSLALPKENLSSVETFIAPATYKTKQLETLFCIYSSLAKQLETYFFSRIFLV